MPAERPARVVRCEVLASWRGLRLQPNHGLWDLVPIAMTEVEIDGRIERISEPPEVVGLTLREVEEFLADPRR